MPTIYPPLTDFQVKCSRYWPDEVDDAFRFGNLIVSLLEQNEIDGGDLLHRKIILQHLEHPDEVRKISHFQYTAWPDHGLPPSTRAFLDLVELVDAANPTKVPIVVHCSAGIGRSGTFCTVHSTLEKFKKFLQSDEKEEPKLNVVQTVLFMREQRPGMVQTKVLFESQRAGTVHVLLYCY